MDKQIDETPLRALIARLDDLTRTPGVEAIDKALEFIAWMRPRLVRPDMHQLYAETTAVLLDVRVIRRRGDQARDTSIGRIIRQRAIAEDALQALLTEETEAKTSPTDDGGTSSC